MKNRIAALKFSDKGIRIDGIESTYRVLCVSAATESEFEAIVVSKKTIAEEGRKQGKQRVKDGMETTTSFIKFISRFSRNCCRVVTKKLLSFFRPKKKKKSASFNLKKNAYSII